MQRSIVPLLVISVLVLLNASSNSDGVLHPLEPPASNLPLDIGTLSPFSDQAASINTNGTDVVATPINEDSIALVPGENIGSDPSATSSYVNVQADNMIARSEDASSGHPTLSARSGRQDEISGRTKTAASLEEAFIATVVDAAQKSQAATGVPASVTIAQAMLESDMGRSRLSREANNFFGIKARGKPGPAGVVYMDTWESIGGKDVIIKEPFRAYNNMLESFIDHGLFFLENPRYAAAMQNIGNAQLFAKLIHQAGYATDPKYSDKLIALMNKFNLYVYDLPR